MRALQWVLIGSLMSSVPAHAISPQAQDLMDRAAAECRDFENGEFDAGEAVSEIELRSQFGTVDAEIIDESEYACSSAASLYCGSGGCMLTTSSWKVK